MNCQYKESCAGRDRFSEACRSLEELNRTLCNNNRPHCQDFYGYQRLNRDTNGIIINASVSLARL